MPFREAPTFQEESADPHRWALAVTALLAALAAFRLITLWLTPLELYPDEAQYWAWSRTLSWGYFSKPPMIAWLIAGSTAVGGDDEVWVRLPALICQTAAAGFLFLAGRRLWNARTGFWAAAIYALAPGVALSSGVASTDAPLLMFLAAALWAYALMLRGGGAAAAVGLGCALGLAFLSKYAALYVLGALALHAALSPEGRRAWTPARAVAGLAAFAVIVAPNLIWNALNGFETVAHTASNANWNAGDLANPGEALEFVASQLGVFGPLAFPLFLIGAVGWLRRRTPSGGARSAVLVLALTPLLLVTAQAFLSRANANWAAAFMPAAALVVAAAAQSWRRGQTILLVTAAVQFVVQVLMAAAVVSPAFASAVGLDNGFKRARGWEETARAVAARSAAAGPLTAVAVDSRLLFYELTYYGRDWLARPDAPPLTAWVREPSPQNEAEASRPLTRASGGRVLAVSVTPDFRQEFAAAFARVSPPSEIRVPLDPRRTRDLSVWIGEDYRPGVVSDGRPTPP